MQRAVTEDAKTRLHRAKHKFQEAQRRSRHKAQEYKSKLLEVYRRFKQLKEMYDAQAEELAAVRAVADDDVAAQRRRIRELESEREMFLRAGRPSKMPIAPPSS